MTTPLRASWSFDVPDKTPTSSSVEFPSKGEKTIDVKQGNLVELNEGIHQIRDNLNDLLTHWKDIVGDEGQGKDTNITKTEQQDNEEEVDDESSEGEE